MNSNNKRGRYDKPDSDQEVKSLDQGLTSRGFLASSGPQLLMAPPQLGAAYYQRIGLGIKTFSLEIRGDITITKSNINPTSQQYARIIVFYDRQTNGNNPGLADFLLSTDTGGGVTSNVFSGLSPLNRKRFMILRDDKFMLPAVGALGVQDTSQGQVYSKAQDMQYHQYIPVGGLMTLFKGSTGAVADIATGGLFLLVLGEDTNATAAWTFTYNARASFVDATS